MGRPTNSSTRKRSQTDKNDKSRASAKKSKTVAEEDRNGETLPRKKSKLQLVLVHRVYFSKPCYHLNQQCLYSFSSANYVMQICNNFTDADVDNVKGTHKIGKT